MLTQFKSESLDTNGTPFSSVGTIAHPSISQKALNCAGHRCKVTKVVNRPKKNLQKP